MRLVIKAVSASDAGDFAARRGFKVVHTTAAFTGSMNKRFIVQTKGASAADKAIAAAWSQETPRQGKAKIGALLTYHTEQEKVPEGWVFRGSHNCDKCRKTVPYINRDGAANVCDNCAFGPESEAD